MVINRRRETAPRRSARIPSSRRQIARTIVSERVWAAIANRGRNRRRIESDSEVITEKGFIWFEGSFPLSASLTNGLHCFLCTIHIGPCCH